MHNRPAQAHSHPPAALQHRNCSRRLIYLETTRFEDAPNEHFHDVARINPCGSPCSNTTVVDIFFARWQAMVFAAFWFAVFGLLL